MQNSSLVLFAPVDLTIVLLNLGHFLMLLYFYVGLCLNYKKEVNFLKCNKYSVESQLW